MSPDTMDSDRTFSLERLGRTFDIIVFLLIWIVAFWFGPRSWLWYSSLAASAISFVFWMVARLQLGNSFMIGVDAKELVTHGLYRRIRHPIYLFGGIAHFAALLALQNWWILGIWLFYAAVIQWARIRKEDLALEAAFGEAFREHRRNTWI